MSAVTAPVVMLRQQTLDELWHEAETLGVLRVWTRTDFYDKVKNGYDVTLIGHRCNTKLEVKRSHTVLICALADVINEAREMGLGDSS